MGTGRAVAIVSCCLLAALISPVGVGATAAPNPCVGTVTDEPERATLISIQGARGSEKTDALLVGLRPDGSVIGVHNGTDHGKWWLYDVDPLATGNLLLSTTEPGISVIEEIDPATGTHVDTLRFETVLDSHDVDAIGDGELLVNDMSRNGNDRVFVADRETGEIVWQYRFANSSAFPESGGGEFGSDWTHNNDVEAIGDGVFMVSVRNFDTVVAIDRETKEIVWQLGADDDHGTLFEQHNPDYLETPTGDPTVLVADSRSDRVVEYTRRNGSWMETWAVTGFNEPRDADRLPNGNTLVTDRRGDRLVEVTPTGEVVWEVYTPWQPYDAERLGTGDESTGPTMRAAGTTGQYEVSGGAGGGTARKEACYAFLRDVESERLVPAPGREAGASQPPGSAAPDRTNAPLVGIGLAAALLILVPAVLIYGDRS